MLPLATSVPGDQHMFCNYHLQLGKCDEIISVRSVCFPSSISYRQNIACAYLSIHFDFLSDAKIIFNFIA